MSLVTSLAGTQGTLPIVLALYAGLLVAHAWLEGTRTGHAPHDDMVGAGGIVIVAVVGLVARDLQPVLAVLGVSAATLALYEMGWLCWRHRPQMGYRGRAVLKPSR